MMVPRCFDVAYLFKFIFVMTYIGVDVSKDTFVVAYSSDKNSKTKVFKNTTKGIHEFITTISKDEHHCVMEATGNYSALLVYLLSEAGITTSLENPLKVKNFARAMLSTVKTDEIPRVTFYDGGADIYNYNINKKVPLLPCYTGSSRARRFIMANYQGLNCIMGEITTMVSDARYPHDQHIYDYFTATEKFVRTVVPQLF